MAYVALLLSMYHAPIVAYSLIYLAECFLYQLPWDSCPGSRTAVNGTASNTSSSPSSPSGFISTDDGCYEIRQGLVSDTITFFFHVQALSVVIVYLSTLLLCVLCAAAMAQDGAPLGLWACFKPDPWKLIDIKDLYSALEPEATYGPRGRAEFMRYQMTLGERNALPCSMSPESRRDVGGSPATSVRRRASSGLMTSPSEKPKIVVVSATGLIEGSGSSALGSGVVVATPAMSSAASPRRNDKGNRSKSRARK
ncbi:hypothetical protein V5799_020399 [Amblyomma americanum]|uniref:Uncharacterized protein n=1 Tax=Amblyomma americanum TaxID=6943 RepID=A0AAQ4EU65_AMBAM